MTDKKEEIIKYVIDHVANFVWDKVDEGDYYRYITNVCGQRLSMKFNDSVIKQEITFYCPATEMTRIVPTSLANRLFEKVDEHYQKMEIARAEMKLKLMEAEDDIYYSDILKQLKHQGKVSKKRQTNKQTIK